jgi:hypothetical protein
MKVFLRLDYKILIIRKSASSLSSTSRLSVWGKQTCTVRQANLKTSLSRMRTKAKAKCVTFSKNTIRTMQMKITNIASK